MPVRRPGGLSARMRLTLSYAAFLLLACALLLAVVAVFLLRYVPDGVIMPNRPWVPNQSDLVRAFAPRATQAMVLILVLGLVGGWFLAGRMLAPLHRIGEVAQQVAGGSLQPRVALAGRKDEFRELADVFDAMLDRLEAHVAEQGRFAANASHELRTPLAISQAILDVAAADHDRDVDALIARLQEVNRRAVELTEALLLLSRAESRSFIPEPVELSLAAEEAVETLTPLADQRGVTLEVHAEPARVIGSEALLQQLATNLVHNAIVHNLPSGGEVSVRTKTQDGSTVLIVENTGPVIRASRLATLSEPFQRDSERTRGDHVGAGLGLAIARRVAEAHAGSLHLVPRPGGGLVVTVWMPRG